MLHGKLFAGPFTMDSIMNFFVSPIAEQAIASEHNSVAFSGKSCFPPIIIPSSFPCVVFFFSGDVHVYSEELLSSSTLPLYSLSITFFYLASFTIMATNDQEVGPGDEVPTHVNNGDDQSQTTNNGVNTQLMRSRNPIEDPFDPYYLHHGDNLRNFHEISSSILYVESAAAIWKNLRVLFQQRDGTPIYNLKKNLMNLKQDNQTEENQRRSQNLSVDSNSNMAFAFQGEKTTSKLESQGPPKTHPPKRGRPFCTHCNMHRHTIEKCYKIHGYPPGYNKNGKTKEAATNQFQTSNIDCSTSNESNTMLPQLTPNQYQQLLNLLTAQTIGLKQTDPSSSAALLTNNTWTMVPLPPGKHAIRCIWVYRIKYNSDESVERLKTRLVAQGYTQQEGLDFFDTFSPVAKMVTFKLLLAIVAIKQWHTLQLDINNAFLNGDLDEEVYMQLPQGLKLPSNIQGTNLVYKLHKSIYDLKQSSRQWYKKLIEALLEEGFAQSKAIIHSSPEAPKTHSWHSLSMWTTSSLQAPI
uniref:Reverse transcriptase Ty1/copia-type domain-containing protein n=1 Tax=Cannabis sativa TaxID=3483 RepID=A0A803PQS3_CANSA